MIFRQSLIRQRFWSPVVTERWLKDIHIQSISTISAFSNTSHLTFLRKNRKISSCNLIPESEEKYNVLTFLLCSFCYVFLFLRLLEVFIFFQMCVVFVSDFTSYFFFLKNELHSPNTLSYKSEDWRKFCGVTYVIC